MVEAAQTADLEPEIREKFKEVCMMYAMVWGAGTEEQKKSWQEGAGALKKLFEEKKEEMVNEVNTCFAENSTDGLANEAQFIAFTQKMEDLHAQRGISMPCKTEAILKPAYENLNQWTPGVDGVSIANIWKQQEITPAIMQEIREEAEAAQP